MAFDLIRLQQFMENSSINSMDGDIAFNSIENASHPSAFSKSIIISTIKRFPRIKQSTFNPMNFWLEDVINLPMCRMHFSLLCLTPTATYTQISVY